MTFVPEVFGPKYILVACQHFSNISFVLFDTMGYAEPGYLPTTANLSVIRPTAGYFRGDVICTRSIKNYKGSYMIFFIFGRGELWRVSWEKDHYTYQGRGGVLNLTRRRF